MRVHVEDQETKAVHWDAVYDLDHDEGLPKLSATTPAAPESGAQPRFLTFCPPEGGGAHRYELNVTALDAGGAPIGYAAGKKAQCAVGRALGRAGGGGVCACVSDGRAVVPLHLLYLIGGLSRRVSAE